MAKLTRAQVAELRRVLAEAEAAEGFLARPDVVVARTGRADDVAAYVPNGQSGAEFYPHAALRPVAKELGSLLCCLPRATSLLARFLVDHG